MPANILVVEDEPSIQELIAANLQHAGHQVLRAYDAEEAERKVREVLPDAAHEPAAHAFFAWLWQEHITTQYILYDTEDVAHYWRLRASGAIRPGRHWVLFVLGRYSKGQLSSPSDLLPFLAAWEAGTQAQGEAVTATPWAMCAFGPREAECALAAVLHGGHARIGFENNLYLPDGSVSPDNAASLRALTAAAAPLALAPMTAQALRALTR